MSLIFLWNQRFIVCQCVTVTLAYSVAQALKMFPLKTHKLTGCFFCSLLAYLLLKTPLEAKKSCIKNECYVHAVVQYATLQGPLLTSPPQPQCIHLLEIKGNYYYFFFFLVALTLSIQLCVLSLRC